MKGLIAKKVGMTQVFDENGNLIPVTVIHVEPNTVVALKDKETFGYDAVVLGLGDKKKSQIKKPYAGQFPEGIAPKQQLKEFRDFEGEVKVGDQIGVELFESVRYLDVTATSKGKGFQGVMKRWGFHGGRAHMALSFIVKRVVQDSVLHQEEVLRTLKCQAVQVVSVTVQNLKIVKIDPEMKVMMVRGSVPGNKDCALIIKSAVKKS